MVARTRTALPRGIAIPPVRLLGLEELEALAQASDLMGRLQSYVAWVGPGRKLTQSGRLKLADLAEAAAAVGRQLPPACQPRSMSEVPQLAWVFALAEESGLVEHRASGLSAGPLGQGPLQAWWRLFLAVLDVGVAVWFRGEKAWQPPWTPLIDDVLADFLVQAYLLQEEGLTATELADEVWEGVLEETGVVLAAGALRPALDVDVARVLEVLRQAGVIEPGAGLALSPLGTWAVHRLLVEEGRDALAVWCDGTDDPGDLLTYWASLERDRAFSDIDAWLAARPPEDVVQTLVGAAAGQADRRAMFYNILERLPDEAAGAVGLLEGDPAFGPYVRVWRIGRGLADHGSLTEQDAMHVMVDQLAAMLIIGGHEALVRSWSTLSSAHERAGILAGLARSSRPEAAIVLATLAEHGDPATRAALRGGVSQPGRRVVRARRGKPSGGAPRS